MKIPKTFRVEEKLFQLFQTNWMQIECGQQGLWELQDFNVSAMRKSFVSLSLCECACVCVGVHICIRAWKWVYDCECECLCTRVCCICSLGYGIMMAKGHCEWVGKTPTPGLAPMAMQKLNSECKSSSNRCLDTTSNCISFGSPQLSQSDSNLSIISEPCLINTPLN